jgi:hypothetical protein
MRWKLGVLALLALSTGGYVAAAHLSGGALPLPGVDVGGDRGELRRRTLAFFEDLQFKDFEGAAAQHAPQTRADVDIPFLLERLFVTKPEALEILSTEIVYAELDSDATRARVKVRVNVRDLVSQRAREQEVILYWARTDVGAPWWMDLESSLRPPEAEAGKKH